MDRGKIIALPEDVRKQLDAKLITNGFRDYSGLSKWLADQGFVISRDAVYRHGSKLERRLASIKLATQEAHAIVEAAPDEEGAMNDALMRLLQEKLFSLLIELDQVQLEKVNLVEIGKMVAQLCRASVNQKKWEQEMRAKLGAFKAKAGAEISAVAKSAGLSPEAESRIRKALMGIDV